MGEKLQVLDLGSGKCIYPSLRLPVTRNKGKSHIFVTDTLVRFNYVSNSIRFIFLRQVVPGFPAVDIKISGRYLAPIPYQERRVVSTWASCGDPIGWTVFFPLL